MDTLVSGEHFKRDVRIDFADSKVQIAYALWQVDLPASWVTAHPLIQQFLKRRIGRSEALRDAHARPLVTLLDAQGCFHPSPKSRYTLHEVKAIFDPLRSQWYAEYYAHPAWQQLREGRASVNMLVTWLIHNYHISRAAGIVAARMASARPDAPWAAFFRQDALDEYWHCDAFYSLQTGQLADIGFEQIKNYLPLASSLAFEEHALRVADSDPLGHLLIAYFQESSIAFNEDSSEFYRAVESQYGIAGLFTPWQQHIQIDVDQGHADGLGKLLESDREVSAAELATALRNAWLACRYLCSGLDDIADADADASSSLSLRQPLQVPAQAQYLLGLVHAHAAGRDAPTCTPADLASMRASLASSAFRALGNARQHDDMIACGRWAQALARMPASTEPVLATIWSSAIDNHLQEAARQPLAWLLLAKYVSLRLPQFKLADAWTASLDALLGKHRAGGRDASALCQFDELLERCTLCHELVRDDLLPACDER